MNYIDINDGETMELSEWFVDWFGPSLMDSLGGLCEALKQLKETHEQPINLALIALLAPLHELLENAGENTMPEAIESAHMRRVTDMLRQLCTVLAKFQQEEPALTPWQQELEQQRRELVKMLGIVEGH